MKPYQLTGAALLAAARLFAAEARHAPGLPTVRAIRAPAPVVVDGRLDDAAWNQAEPATAFLQIDPAEGQPATEDTELRLAYDDRALYVGIRCLDREPRRIGRQLSRRDVFADADRVTVYLDARHDHLTGAFFQLSAAGVQRDAAIFNDAWDDPSWDAVWESAVGLDDGGWTAEMRIPYSELRFPTSEEHTWGINVSRFIRRKNETAWLVLVPKKESGLASRMGHVVGIQGIKPRRHLALTPYVLGSGQYVTAAAGDPFRDGSRYPRAAGLDVKYGVTSALTLDATINPDFGQVEVDPAVVNLTEFETFFEEKRPFFIEGADIFTNFGRNGANNFWGFNRAEPILFYTRRIGRSPQGTADGDYVDRPTATTILAAARLTGKTASGWSIGVLDAVTAREWATVETAGRRTRLEVEPFTHSLVGRVLRDFGRGSVGLLGMSTLRQTGSTELRAALVDRAHLFGVDGHWFFDSRKDWVVTGRIAGSRLDGSPEALRAMQEAPQHYFQRPDARRLRLDPTRTSLSGWTGSLNLNRNSGSVQVNSALWANSPGFESNDLGFNFRSDRFGGHAVVTVRKTDPDRWTRRRSFSLAPWAVYNFDRERQASGVHVLGNAQLLNYWSVGGIGFRRFRSLNDQLTRGGPSAIGPARTGGGMWFESDARRRVTVMLEAFYSAAEFDSSDLEAFATLRIRPAAWLDLSLGPNLLRSRAAAQWVVETEDPLATATFGHRYVFGRLDQTQVAMTTRLNWILSPRLSFQVYAQPLLSVGDYYDFKELARPRTFEFRRYGVDGGGIQQEPVSRVYTADPDGDGPAPAVTFDDPDFNFKSLRVNAVFRWEWRLGSTLYVVWTQGRQNQEHPGRMSFGRDLGDLFAAPADDLLMVKFTYRFSR